MSELYMSSDIDLWRELLEEYAGIMKKKVASSKNGAELLKLDEWFQKELPSLIAERQPKHITHAEISELMKWKLKRGKFRPRLQQMVESNSAEEVKKCSTEAFKKMPNLGKAIEALTPLKAIGPATASAILAAGCPDDAPFMADEAVLAIPGLQPIQYTLKHYLLYAERIRECRDRLNKLDESTSWTAHRVELALWVSVVKDRLHKDTTAERGTKRKRAK